MDPYEDFDFSSHLPAAQALERLKKYTASQGKGSFYGEVHGNHFKLNHDMGWASVAPELSGYVVAEGEGSRIFVRTHVVGTLDRYGYLILTAWGSLIFAMVEDLDFGAFVVGLFRKFEMVIWPLLGILVLGTVMVVRRTMKKFRKEGRFQVISRFMEYMDAEEAISINNALPLKQLLREPLVKESK